MRNRSWISAVCALALVTCAVPVMAQSQVSNPGYFRVTGVVANDVLNVRRAPDAGAEILGGLMPGAAPVEVFETRGSWGRIVFEEANGWVSLAFLSPVEVTFVPDTRLPVRLSCAGTEPFWSLEIIDTSRIVFEALGGGTFDNAIVASGAFTARPNADFIWSEGGGGQATVSVRREICSDGMSDRDYPMSIDLIIRDGAGGRAYDGCCLRRIDEK